MTREHPEGIPSDAQGTNQTCTSSANLMPCTHHDGQEEVLELISEAQGIGAEQGEVTLHQLGHGTGQGNEEEEKGDLGDPRDLCLPPLHPAHPSASPQSKSSLTPPLLDGLSG